MSDATPHWLPLGDERNALTDVEELSRVVRSTMANVTPTVRISGSRANSINSPPNASASLGFDEYESVTDSLGEDQDDYVDRLARQTNGKVDPNLILRLIEGADPLSSIVLPEPRVSLLNDVQLAGVDSTIATIDQFDAILAITLGDFHWLNKAIDFQFSRGDLYVLNPKLVKSEIPRKIHRIQSRADVAGKLSGCMKELEYSLASRHGMGKLVVMDGTLFGQEKHLAESLVSEGIIFCSIVKNPVSTLVQSWYADKFLDYGYENAALDAVVYNDLLRPGTRSPLIFAEMVSWTSKIFAYYKPSIPETTVLRIEIPTDYAYLADHIIDAVHSACSIGGDPHNNTAMPIVHAEYVARAMLPDPHQISEYLRSTLQGDAQGKRLRGSFNERRGFPLVN